MQPKNVLLILNFLFCSTYSALSQPTLPELLKIHEEHVKAIQNGSIDLLYSHFSKEPAKTNTREIERIEKVRRSVIADKNIKESERTMILRNLALQAQKVNENYERPSSPYQIVEEEMVRKYIFDIPSSLFMVTEEPVKTVPLPKDSTFFNEDSRISLMKDGSQVRYYPRLKRAVIDHFRETIPPDMPYLFGILPHNAFKQMPQKTVVEHTTLNGIDLFAFVLGDEETGKLRLIVDPRFELKIVSAEFMAGNKVYRRIVASDYHLFDGIFLPQNYEDTFYEPDNTTKKRERFTIRNASLNKGISKDRFSITFDPETFVVDAKIGVSYTLRKILDPGVFELDEETLPKITNRGLDMKSTFGMAELSGETSSSMSLDMDSPLKPDHASRSEALRTFETGISPNWFLLILCAAILISGIFFYILKGR